MNYEYMHDHRHQARQLPQKNVLTYFDTVRMVSNFSTDKLSQGFYLIFKGWAGH